MHTSSLQSCFATISWCPIRPHHLSALRLRPGCACLRYLIPGGSAGHFEREGYTFDVGSSMMFGLGKEGTTNLITRALAAVGKSVETAPDPTQIHYHLPPSVAHPQVRPDLCPSATAILCPWFQVVARQPIASCTAE